MSQEYGSQADQHWQRVLGGLGTVMGSWLAYPNDPWNAETLKKPYPYDPARAKALLTEAGYPNGFEGPATTEARPVGAGRIRALYPTKPCAFF